MLSTAAVMDKLFTSPTACVWFITELSNKHDYLCSQSFRAIQSMSHHLLVAWYLIHDASKERNAYVDNAFKNITNCWLRYFAISYAIIWFRQRLRLLSQFLHLSLFSLRIRFESKEENDKARVSSFWVKACHVWQKSCLWCEIVPYDILQLS